jgi:hypothetical protein
VSSDQSKLIRAARDLLERPDPMTAGIWPRASALLARQALESALDELWLRRAKGLELCSAKAQLLCLPAYLGDRVAGCDVPASVGMPPASACRRLPSSC